MERPKAVVFPFYLYEILRDFAEKEEIFLLGAEFRDAMTS